jgi:hypothetical protein
LILLFSTGYTPNLQPRRKNIVESARDKHGTTTKTPLTTQWNLVGFDHSQQSTNILANLSRNQR